MEIIKNYRDDKRLRDSFNQLAEKVHGLNFEGWYQNGYWNQNYNPYSVVMDGKIVANVSVNEMDFLWDNEKQHLIQIGTVMTDPDYRNRGLIRRIMQQIEEDYKDHCDGMYLFANDTVLDFYPKFGYHTADQYEYMKTVTITEPRTVVSVSMENRQDWDAMKAIIDHSQNFSCFAMNGYSELPMFYLSQFMKENVYYSKELNVYMVAEEEESELLLHAVYAKEKVDLDQVISSFGTSVKLVKLGFVPENKDTFLCRLFVEENTTLFVKGEAFNGFTERHLMFPLLSHA